MTPPQHATERTRGTGLTVDATRTSEGLDYITNAVSKGSSQAGDVALSKDDIFHILQNERRRRVLEYLAETEPVHMPDIAEQIAAVEHETTVHQLTSTQRQRVYIALYQAHLPKLADLGLLTYNQSRGIVEQTRAADQVMR